MMRVRPARSVYATTRSRPAVEEPILRNRCSSSEWSGSEMVTSSGSLKTVIPSEKSTVVLDVLRGFFRIPLEFHRFSLRCFDFVFVRPNFSLSSPVRTGRRVLRPGDHNPHR